MFFGSFIYLPIPQSSLDKCLFGAKPMPGFGDSEMDKIRYFFSKASRPLFMGLGTWSVSDTI